MVAKVREALNLPPATWISIILIIVAGVSAFTAVQLNAGSNAARIQGLEQKLTETFKEQNLALATAKQLCLERHYKLEDDFRAHCAWGIESKAAQDNERAIFGIRLEHVIQEQQEMKEDIKEILDRVRNGHIGH
jgi:hypothetical protein